MSTRDAMRSVVLVAGQLREIGCEILAASAHPRPRVVLASRDRLPPGGRMRTSWAEESRLGRMMLLDPPVPGLPCVTVEWMEPRHRRKTKSLPNRRA